MNQQSTWPDIENSAPEKKNHGAVAFGFFCFFLAALLVLTAGGEVRAFELLVPDEYFSITEAMEEAMDGDTVVVYPGTYYERIQIKEGVNLVSYAGDDGDELVDGPGMKKVLRRTLRTIIDGSELEEPGYLISFPQDTPASMKVDGFTFQNVPKYISGVQLFIMEIRGCSPVVENNIFTGNLSWGGILSTGLGVGMGPALDTVARPVIRNNVVYNNYSLGIGNGSNSAAHIIDNEIFDNTYNDPGEADRVAPAIGVREQARPIIEHNICYRNGTGVGAINFDSFAQPLIIRGNTFFHNRRAGIGLRGIGSLKTGVKAVIENNTIYGNLTAGIRCTKTDNVVIRYNNVYANRKSGISLWDVGQTVIEDNEIHGNLTAGIRLLDVAAAVVQRNAVYQNVTAGIDFIGWKR
jgi:parallel beta-helix repeat protein